MVEDFEFVLKLDNYRTTHQHAKGQIYDNNFTKYNVCLSIHIKRPKELYLLYIINSNERNYNHIFNN